MLRVELHQASLVADAGMLALWGFETFNVLAISRKFAELEPDRVGELVGAWALVDTSWRYSQVPAHNPLHRLLLPLPNPCRAGPIWRDLGYANDGVAAFK